MKTVADIVRHARADLGATVVMRAATGPIRERALAQLLALERRGLATPNAVDRAFSEIASQVGAGPKPSKSLAALRIAEAKAALDAAERRFYRAEVEKVIRERRAQRRTKKSPSTTIKGIPLMPTSHDTDTPSELGSYSDGVSDDAAFHPEIIGCNYVGSGLRQHAVGGLSSLTVAGLGKLAVSGSGVQHVAVAGLADLTVAGIPSYLFTQPHISRPDVRHRISAAISRLSPKLRRRVLSRLRAAVQAARVSGEIRSVTPSIAGAGDGGWSASSISVGRCPYANVAGAFTP